MKDNTVKLQKKPLKVGVSLYLAAELVERVKQLADDAGISLSAAVEQVIDMGLKCSRGE